MSQILFVDHQAEIIGGGQQSLLALMRGLDRKRYQLRFAGPGGGLSRAVRQAGVPVQELNFPSLRGLGGFGAAVSLGRLGRLVRQERVELLHANGSRCMFYAGLVGRLAKVPVIWHVRIAVAERGWDWLLGQMATRIVAVSEAVRCRLSPGGLEKKTRVIYNGVELAPYVRANGAQVRRELGQGAKWLIGMVARLTEEKDHETFLQAASRIAAQLSGVRFLVVGGDPDPGQGRQRELRRLADELGLGERLVFAGERSDLPELMASLDLLIHCAHQEGFGRVLVEAMAAGRAVVATAVGGIPEVVADGQTGILVPAGDPEGVANAALALLSDPGRRQAMGRAGQVRAQRLFSLEAHVAQIQALYEEVLVARG